MASLIIGDKTVLFDDDMSHEIESREWNIILIRNVFYARSGQLFMHRLVMRAKKGQIVDHIDRNGLHNLRGNLRFASTQGNKANGLRKNATSQYVGVSKTVKKAKPFRAVVKHEGKPLHLGYFETEIEAAKAYDEFTARKFGDLAILNFPLN